MSFDPQAASDLLYQAAKFRGMTDAQAAKHAELPEARPQARRRRKGVHESASSTATRAHRDAAARFLNGRSWPADLPDSTARMLATLRALAAGRPVERYVADKAIQWTERQS